MERIGELVSVTSPADYGVSPFLSFFCFARRTTLFYSLQIREIGEKFVAFFPASRIEWRIVGARIVGKFSPRVHETLTRGNLINYRKKLDLAAQRGSECVG